MSDKEYQGDDILCIDDKDIMIRYYFIMNGSEDSLGLSSGRNEEPGVYKRERIENMQ